MFSKIIGVSYIKSKLTHSNSSSSLPQESPSPSRNSTSSQRPRTRASLPSTDELPRRKSNKKHKTPTTINRAQVQQSIPSSMALTGKVRRHNSSPVVPTIHAEETFGLPGGSPSLSSSPSSSLSFAIDSPALNENYTTSNGHMFDGQDNFLFSNDLTIDMNLKLENTNLSTGDGHSIKGTTNLNDDVWSYNPEDGHTVYVSDKKKSVRFS
ncbi:hypothetical protein JA1_000650 [Spathaspora sp. JA1]|nr:hypothetical protein JA1_000650 [Spathaspora sp. JA1]